MARRRRQSTAEDILDVVSLLPWWGGLALALLLYLFFHWLAGRPQPPMTSSGQLSGLIFHTYVTAIARVAQILLPVPLHRGRGHLVHP